MADRLFAVTLGGRAKGCNTELHDVVFVTGPTIEATYGRLMDLWFGTPEGLHLDSWMALDVVDGHRVALQETEPAPGRALYFVNLGAYADGLFGELHANKLLVAGSPAAAKARAKRILMRGGERQIHTDDLYDVDDCLKVSRVGRWHVALAPTDEPGAPVPVNGYHVIPKPLIAAYLARHPERARG